MPKCSMIKKVMNGDRLFPAFGDRGYCSRLLSGLEIAYMAQDNVPIGFTK